MNRRDEGKWKGKGMEIGIGIWNMGGNQGTGTKDRVSAEQVEHKRK